MLGVITGFIDELRAAGVPVSMVEAIDGMRAVGAIDIGERVALRETLRATLIKNQRHERAFDTAFDVYFSTIPQPDTSQQPENERFELPPSQGRDVADTPPFDLESLLDDLLQALTDLDEDLAHHDQCIEASRLLEHLRRHDTADIETLRRLFR